MREVKRSCSIGGGIVEFIEIWIIQLKKDARRVKRWKVIQEEETINWGKESNEVRNLGIGRSGFCVPFYSNQSYHQFLKNRKIVNLVENFCSTQSNDNFT